MKRRIALAGNPNSGKTSLFNELTGANQYVGNWPGVTVDRKGGQLKDFDEIELQDLPGTYSLSPYSPEELVSRKYLLEEKPDLVLNVVDATNLERNLYLTTQLLETGLPVIVALNMIDLVEKNGQVVNAAELSARLNCPVIKVSAHTHTGIFELINALTGELPAAPAPLPYTERVERAISAVMTARGCDRWTAIKLLENDSEVTSELSNRELHDLQTIRMQLEDDMDDDVASIIAGGRYDAICAFTPQIMSKPTPSESLSSKVDKVLTSRLFGLPIFVLAMYIIYYISVTTVGTWGTDFANDVLFGPIIGGWLQGFLGSEAASVESMVLLSGVLAMCIILPSMLRRLHDIGLNGAWLYLVVAPFLLEYMCPHLPGVLHSIVMYLLLAANAVLLGLCIFKPGEKTANVYGNATKKFITNPFRMEGRGSRREFNTWVVVLSLISLGIAHLGTLTLDCNEQLYDLIENGIVGGVGAVLGFLPQMAVLFLLLSLLEDCGYMARVAFMMDRVFRTFGLSGKSFIPLLVSMGCGVPGVMATRTIENEKDRRMSVMLTTFIPCGAKLPIIALIGALITQSAAIGTIAYFAGIASVILAGIILRKTHIFAGSYTPFVMELPAYHVPHGINVNLRAMERCKAFVKKAGTVIFLACALIWVTGNYNWTLDRVEENSEESMLGTVGNGFAPIFQPLGWGDWKPAVATVTGLVAKEIVIGTFGVLYGEEDTPAEEAPAPADATAAAAEAPAEEEGDELPRTGSMPKVNAMTALVMAAWQYNDEVRADIPATTAAEEEEEEAPAEEDNTPWYWQVANYFFGAEVDEETSGVAENMKKAGVFTSLSALSFMLFNLLCAPCFAACGAIRREMNSARWTIFAIGFMCVWAYVIALLVYQLGTWITTGAFTTATGVACAILAAMLYMLLRPNPHKQD